MLLWELSWRHLLGGRFSGYLRHRWKRWASAAVALVVTVAIALGLAFQGSPVWGAVSLFAVGCAFFLLRRLAHGPLPEYARGAYASAVSFIAFLGIALAVMTLIVVISVMDGFTQDIQKALLKTTAEVTVTSFGERLDPRFADLVRKVEGVVHVDPYIENDMLLKLAGFSRPLPVRVRGEESARHRRPGGPDIEAGDWSALDTPGLAIIGAELAASYLLRPGDRIWIISSQGALTPMGMVPATEELEIAGIFRSGFYEVDQQLVLTGLETARRLTGAEDVVTGLDVRGTDPFLAPELASRIEREIEAPLLVLPWSKTRRNLYEAMRTEKIAMFVIESLLILIASFNISSTLFMAVSRKTREIGLLLAMGFPRRSVLALFSLEGTLLGGLGAVAGAAAGVAFAVYLREFPVRMPGAGEVYYINTIPVALSWELVGSAVGVAFLLSLLAALYPAWRASRLAPARALRYE